MKSNRVSRKWFLSRFKKMIMSVDVINRKRVRYTLSNNMCISFPLKEDEIRYWSLT